MAVRATAFVGDLFRDEVMLRVIALGCAVFLLLAMVAPRELARTSWVEGNENAFTRVNDDPSGYVGLLSLCGLIAVGALVVLAVGVRVRSRRAVGATAALVAAVAFAFGLYVTGTYWLGFPRGTRLREGREMLGSGAEADFPLLLPVFALAALAGIVSAVALAVRELKRLDENSIRFRG